MTLPTSGARISGRPGERSTGCSERREQQDGLLHVSDRPGIGISVNEDALKERTEAGYKPL